MKNARWVRLADDLTRGITNGDYPLDSYLPTEMELCEKYNVSRYTVRLALADLTRMGLIKRWPRLGSKVVSVGFDEMSGAAARASVTFKVPSQSICVTSICLFEFVIPITIPPYK